MYTTLK